MPVGAGNPVTLCDLGIFTDEAAEPVPTQNPDARAQIRRKRTPAGRALFQRPMRLVGVVVIRVLV